MHTAAYGAFVGTTKKNVLAFVVPSVFLLGILATGSRAAVVAAVAVAMLWAWPLFSSGIKKVGGVGAVLGFVCLSWYSFVFRLGSTVEHFEKTLLTLNMALVHPFGLGLGTTAASSQRLDGLTAITPENTYVSFALELGVLGALLFIFTLLSWFLEDRKRPTAAGGMVVAVGIISLFLHPLEDGPTAILFGLFVGLMLCLSAVTRDRISV